MKRESSLHLGHRLFRGLPYIDRRVGVALPAKDQRIAVAASAEEGTPVLKQLSEFLVVQNAKGFHSYVVSEPTSPPTGPVFCAGQRAAGVSPGRR